MPYNTVKQEEIIRELRSIAFERVKQNKVERRIP
jgi:hypothetical protein